jgi:hypothetical protein
LDISIAIQIQNTQRVPVPKKCCYNRLRDNVPIPRSIAAPMIPVYRMSDGIYKLLELLRVRDDASDPAVVDGRMIDVNI